jgi:AcrR family transcriptional regulator
MDESSNLRAESEVPQESTWQAQKSAATRRQIIEAAIDCLVKLGYARTTTTRIADAAGLSRGAMLHHFPTKLDIVRAAVTELHAKRLKAFRKAIAGVPAAGRDRVRAAVDAYWQHARHPIFVAFFELSVAARTDPELEAIMRPAQAAFDEAWVRTAREAFPEWQGNPDAFDLALHVSRYMLEGMAVSFLTHEETERGRLVRDYLEKLLIGLRPEADRARNSNGS